MKPRPFRVASCAGLVVAAVALGAAQQTRPVFRKTTSHVLVDVVVTDGKDRPITDLTAADFEIAEAGRAQTIADFERILVPPAARDIDLSATPAPPPDVASNAPPPHTARAFVFVLDDVTLKPKDIIPIKRLLTEFLRTMSPDDEAAITYTSRSDLGQDFTRDTGRLVRAINGLRDDLGSFVGRKRDALFVLNNVVNTLAAARETRSAVVFVSEGYPNFVPDPEDLALFEHASHAGVPIYTYDPRGLMAPELGLEGHMEDQTPEHRAGLDAAKRAGQDWLLMTAENTGARGFVNQSNMPGAVADLMTENGSYYLLGYYPSAYAEDGKFHPISVKVKRPGLHVRARAGYTTEKPRPANAPPPRLVDSLEDGLPGGDLVVSAFATPVSATSRGAKVLLTLDLTYPEAVAGVPRADDQLQLVWLAVDPDAHVRASGQNVIRLPVTQIPAQSFALSVEDLLEVPQGKSILRVAVSSQALHKQATVHLPITVDGWSGKGLSAGSIVLGLPPDRGQRLAKLGPDAGVPFHPTTARTFAAGQRLRAFTRVFAADSAGVTATLTVKRGEDVVRTVALRVAPAAGLKSTLDCDGEVDLGGLSAGPYVLEFTVHAGPLTALRAIGIAVR